MERGFWQRPAPPHRALATIRYRARRPRGGGGSRSLSFLSRPRAHLTHLTARRAGRAGRAGRAQGSVAQPGQPISRTRDEVASLAQGKHESALVPNVVVPHDIGVSFGMIGGLIDVKQILRQCVSSSRARACVARRASRETAAREMLARGLSLALESP